MSFGNTFSPFRDDLHAPIFGVKRDLDLPRALYDRHLDDDELLSDLG